MKSEWSLDSLLAADVEQEVMVCVTQTVPKSFVGVSDPYGRRELLDNLESMVDVCDRKLRYHRWHGFDASKTLIQLNVFASFSTQGFVKRRPQDK